MAIEIKELVVRAIVSPPQGKDGGAKMEGKKKRKLQSSQQALDVVNYVLKNEKER